MYIYHTLRVMYDLYYVLFDMYYILHIAYGRHMGWQRFMGSLNCQVSFAKEPYKFRILFQKRPGNVGSVQVVATPYE